MARPSKYKKEYCEGLVKHMAQGNPFDTYGCEIGVTDHTLYNWCKKHKEFLDAKKRGEKLCKKWWLTLGKGLSAGRVQGNAAVYIFTMKNLFMWRDKVETVESDAFDDIDFVDE